jgi:hypothetical protein
MKAVRAHHGHNHRIGNQLKKLEADDGLITTLARRQDAYLSPRPL